MTVKVKREGVPSKRQSKTAIRTSLREFGMQLSLLNRQIGAQAGIKEVDFDCLEILKAHGPLSPSALARRAGLHPATVTGVLDRLERATWVARERDPADRRGVVVRALKDRDVELFRLYAGMNGAMDRIYAGYSEDDLALLADFLRRAAEAGRGANEDLASSPT